ncbi:MAG: beta-glucosidase, partial [Symbiobacteriaceae bacterium]|nr:beta-glucosidase [Symbiobacteriaceae bacterium]
RAPPARAPPARAPPARAPPARAPPARAPPARAPPARALPARAPPARGAAGPGAASPGRCKAEQNRPVDHRSGKRGDRKAAGNLIQEFSYEEVFILADIEALLAGMTLKEKVALLSGTDAWHTAPIPRLGLDGVTMTDGPHGVRATAEYGRIPGAATAFPTGIAMAASWDPDLIHEVGQALAEETLAMGCDVLLGPCVNIIRHPLAGRTFESFSEDPILAGRIGAAWVQGLQSRGAGASLKHFACNNQETERDRGSSEVDERAMREIYLRQFELVVKEANPWTVMCAYNRVNGTYASQHDYLLNQILKGEWGYDGPVISDWGANHEIYESVKGGLDLEMPGPPKYFGRLLLDAVRKWQVAPEVIDNAARRMLRLMERCGKLDQLTAASRPAGTVNTKEHQDLARRLAAESIVLLKNERQMLPLDPQRLRKVAVIGPCADEAPVSGGGSAYVEPPYRISPLDGLKQALKGADIIYEQGCTYRVQPPYFTADLLGRYFGNPNFAGEPLLERTDPGLNFHWLGNWAAETPSSFAIRWTGRPPLAVGSHTLRISHTGVLRIYVDGTLLLENHGPELSADWLAVTATVQIPGGEHELTVEYIRPEGHPWPHLQVRISQDDTADADAAFERAVAAARGADLALLFVGYPPEYESEGHDRPDLSLTGRQAELIRAVAAANPNTVVVLNTGAPVDLDWADQVPALLQAWYSGMEGGHAIVDVLLGAVNPSGKLPVTFPARLADTPAYHTFPGKRQVIYGESIFVGYRWYDLKGLDVAYPFGHGLSYTRFAYSDLTVSPDGAQVSVTVTNVGPGAGKETVQLYVSDPEASLPRPPQELKAFAKVALVPGESATVTFELDERAFAFYDPSVKRWVAEPGVFRMRVGSSSREIRAEADVHR